MLVQKKIEKRLKNGLSTFYYPAIVIAYKCDEKIMERKVSRHITG